MAELTEETDGASEAEWDGTSVWVVALLVVMLVGLLIAAIAFSVLRP